MNLRTTISYVNPPQYLQSQINPAVAAGNSAAVQYWQQNFMPLHFSEGAFARYGYQYRRGQDEPEFLFKHGSALRGLLGGLRHNAMVKNPHYYWTKKRAGFGTNPLVRTGASRRAMDSVKIRTNSKKATATWPLLSRYFYQYRLDRPRTDGKPPIDKADEATRIVESELDPLARAHQQAMLDFLETMPVRREYQVISI